METTIEPVRALQLSNPKDITDFANVLKKFIIDNKLSCTIQGKQYSYCDGWKFAGLNFGLSAIPHTPKNLSSPEEIKYSCDCDIINLQTERKVGFGFALCSNKEAKKKSFDEYAIASMAQTRAIAKAYRNLIGFIMNAAGFEAAPAEEMEGDQYHQKVEMSEEIFKTILEFTEAERLLKWAQGLDKSIQKNTKFRKAVQSHLNKVK